MLIIIGIVLCYFLCRFIIKYNFKRKYIKESQDVENALDKFFEEY